MDARRAEKVRDKVCRTKNAYSKPTAREVAAEQSQRSGRKLSVYRCPFSRPVHYHIGHTPSMGSVAEIAAAIRFFATGYEGD